MALHELVEFAINKYLAFRHSILLSISSEMHSHLTHKQTLHDIIVLLHSRFFIIQRTSFHNSCGMMTMLFFLTIQCTWTPEVTTSIYESEDGTVSLQTSSTFHIPPQHPQSLTVPLVKQILEGIYVRQERGILQEIFLSDTQQSPIFSATQIDFLAPHLVNALSLATEEELIVFRMPRNEDRTTRRRGTLAVFSPSIFVLTVQNHENSTKMAPSSRYLQTQTTLLFSEKQAMLQPEEAQRFRKISSKNSWIAINYATLNQATPNHQEDELASPVPITIPQSKKTDQDLNTVLEHVQDLHKKIDAQAEEIQRLQQAAPK